MRSFVCALILICASACFAQTNSDTSSTLTLNTRIRSKLLIDPNTDPQVGVRKRLREGHNFQVLLTIPDAAKPGGPLLDPDSVEVKWDGKLLTSFVYYTMPKLAVVMASFPKDQIASGNKGELEVSARLLGSNTEDAGWRLPIEFSADDATSLSLALSERKGRTIQVVDQAGKGIPNARVFGQRIGDVFATTDDEGNLLLDAMARNSSNPHYAWTNEYWTSGIDPITTQTISLVKKDAARDHRVNFTINDDKGGSVREAILLIDETNYYFHYEAGKNTTCVLPSAKDANVLVLVAGYNSKHVWVPASENEMVIVMDEPSKPQPPPR
ncbi:MAG: hypothetical protein ABI579_04530 [Candidatus Sumerlaeota bacterium]